MTARTIDLLWIAPGLPEGSKLPALGWLDELGGIAEIQGVNLRTVTGRAATVPNVARALRTSDAELVIWSGHGQEDGLITADGTILDGEWIATQARAGAPETFLVGACYSGNRGAFLTSITESVSQAGIHAIGYTVAADDRAAAVYAIELVRALVADADVSQANRVAIRFCRQINPATAAGVVVVPAMLTGYRTIIREIREIRDTTDKLSERIAKVETGQDQLISRIDRCFPEEKTRKTKGASRTAPAPVPA